MERTRHITAWVAALGLLAATSLVAPLHAAGMAVHVDAFMGQALGESSTEAAPADANDDGTVDVLDVQRLIAQGQEAQVPPDSHHEDLPPAVPSDPTAPPAPTGLVFGMSFVPALSLQSQSDKVVSSLERASDAIPSLDRFWRYCRNPHGPPSPISS